jgi:glycosyltransferase involved in cell wall biosynthesis
MNWIVSELFYPDEVSTAMIMTEIAEKLAEKEVIGVICGSVGYEKGYASSQVREISPNIRIHRVGSPALSKNKLFWRAIRLLLLSIKLSFEVIQKVKKDDHLVAVTNPTFFLLFLRILKRFKKFRLTIIIHDVFPENMVPAGLINPDTFNYRLIKEQFDKAYSTADRLIVLGEDMKRIMQSKLLEKSNSDIVVVPNWAEDSIYKISNFNTSDYLGLDVSHKIVFGFAGNLGRVQGLFEFLELFRQANNPMLFFTVVGGGALEEKIKSYVKAHNLENVLLLGPKPRHEQVHFLNACDIALVSLAQGMTGLGVPSKTYNILATGLPILYVGDRESEISSYINDFNCGWAFSWDNPDQIVSFLRDLDASFIGKIEQAGENALNLAQGKFTKDRVLKQIEEVVNKW